MTYNVFGGTLNPTLLLLLDCLLFCEFRDLGEFAKITGANTLFLMYYLVQQAKKAQKLKASK